MAIDFGNTKASDPYTLIGWAIKRHINDERKGSLAAKTFGAIIEDGFLMELVQKQQEIVEKSRENLEAELADRIAEIEKRESMQRTLESLIFKVREKEVEVEQLQEQHDRLLQLIKEDKQQKIGGIEETDPFLSGAKKAYAFILNETNDKNKASKAFNSYLLLGRAGDNKDPYVSEETTAGDEYEKRYPDEPLGYTRLRNRR